MVDKITAEHVDRAFNAYWDGYNSFTPAQVRQHKYLMRKALIAALIVPEPKTKGRNVMRSKVELVVGKFLRRYKPILVPEISRWVVADTTKKKDNLLYNGNDKLRTWSSENGAKQAIIHMARSVARNTPIEELLKNKDR